MPTDKSLRRAALSSTAMHRLARLPYVLSAAAFLTSVAANSQDATVQSTQVQGVGFNGAVLTEDGCEVLAAAKGKSAELREVPGMHVLNRTKADPLVLKSTPDVKISGVMCWRSEARLAPNDYLVPDTTGFSLYIKTDTGNEATDRTIALEKVSGSFRVRLLHGPDWTPAEEDEMQQALTAYNKSVERTRE